MTKTQGSIRVEVIGRTASDMKRWGAGSDECGVEGGFYGAAGDREVEGGGSGRRGFTGGEGGCGEWLLGAAFSVGSGVGGGYGGG